MTLSAPDVITSLLGKALWASLSDLLTNLGHGKTPFQLNYWSHSMSTPVEVSNLRISIQQVKTSLIDTIHRERNYETFLKEAQEERRHLQSYFTALEVKLADMEGRISKPPKNTRKAVEKAVDDASMAFLKNLSPEDKEALVASLMAGLSK